MVIEINLFCHKELLLLLYIIIEAINKQTATPITTKFIILLFYYFYSFSFNLFPPLRVSYKTLLLGS